jgi:hypothetical protein
MAVFACFMTSPGLVAAAVRPITSTAQRLARIDGGYSYSETAPAHARLNILDKIICRR